MFKIFIPVVGLFAVASTAIGYATESHEATAIFTDCKTLPPAHKAHLIGGEAAYDFVADHLKLHGPDSFRPDDHNPESLCLAERFQAGENDVLASYAGFRPGVQTLVYRIEVDGAQRRELMVLYTAVFNLMSGTHLVFSVTETRGGKVDVYAMYDREPPYIQIRSLVEAILAGTNTPVVSAQWQDGEAEPVVNISDAD